MTPKEKAQAIVDSAFNTISINNTGYYHTAKELATLLCDEILRSGALKHLECGYLTLGPTHIEYWQDVKKEIEIL